VGAAARILIPLAAVAAAALLGARSFASFDAQSANPGNGYAFTALYAPTGLTATPSGHDVNLSWTAGSNGSGYSVLGYNNATSQTCSTAFSTVLGSPATTTYTNTGNYTPQGTYECYQVKTTYGSWTSVNSNPTAVAQIGVVASAVATTNGGVAGTLGAGDTVRITFNQPITPSTGPVTGNTVCAVAAASNATIVLGATATGTTSCSATETNNLGTLKGGVSSKAARWAATFAWSAGNTVLTVTVGTRSTGSDSVVSGTWTFNPTTTASKLQSATGAFSACNTNTGGGNCLPTMTGSF
jgi:hypothetical protein